MEQELAPLVWRWQRGQLPHGRLIGRIFRRAGCSYVSSGIGRAPGLRATRALVEAERPDLLISAGFAGALTAEQECGAIERPELVFDAHNGESFRASAGKGVLVSAIRIADARAKRRLARRFGATAVDMEGAAVARVARERGIPFLALKVVSDDLDFPMPPLHAFVGSDGAIQSLRLAGYLTRRPRTWLNLGQLAWNGLRASQILSRELEKLLRSLGVDWGEPGGAGELLRNSVTSPRERAG